ncbi:unnamed protein product [Alopecurus aequalis]
MAASEDHAASKRTVGEEDSSLDAADPKADETLLAGAASAAEVDDGDDLFIQNLNLISRQNLMTPEWIEEMKKLHYEDIDLFNRSYDALDALENEEIESDDEAAAAEFEEWSRRHRASVDLSGLNTVGGESCGVDAVAVYPVGLYPTEEEEQETDHDAVAAASSEESSS